MAAGGHTWPRQGSRATLGGVASADSNLVFEVLPNSSLVISCQTRFNPLDAEWEAWLTAAHALSMRRGDLRLLIVTEGGHPTREQLDRLRELKRIDPPSAIVSPSRALRLLGAALHFVNPTIRCFTPEELPAAYGHLHLKASTAAEADQALERLRKMLPGAGNASRSA